MRTVWMMSLKYSKIVTSKFNSDKYRDMTDEPIYIRKMSAQDAFNLYTSLENLGIKIWIDGGWAVDALLGKVTREHTDLDIAIQRKDIFKLREYLESQGYKDLERAEEKKWDFVLRDEHEHEVDVHSFSFNNEGKIVEKDEYPDGSLDCSGVIGGETVRCVCAQHLVELHTGYKPKEKDRQDVLALCEKFNIKLPMEYLK